MQLQVSCTVLSVIVFLSLVGVAEAFPSIQQPAPDFSVSALMPNKAFQDISLSDYLGKWVVFFWYPLDFTFVCPTEIIAFGDRQAEFEAINTQVIAASCDSLYTHLAWVNTARADGGLGNMKIPIIADFNKTVANQYGVLLNDGKPLRALFIIDPKGILRQITCNDLPVGRNVDEIIRLIQAFQYVETHGEVCPANWQPGELTMKDDPQKSLEYFKAVNADGKEVLSNSKPAVHIEEVVDKAAYNTLIAQKGVVVVYFHAPWCHNCKKNQPVFSRLANENKHIKFLKVNTIEAEALSNELEVEVVPTFYFYKDGVKVGEFKGSDAVKLEAAVKAL